MKQIIWTFDDICLVNLRLTIKEVDSSSLGTAVVKSVEETYQDALKDVKEFYYLQKCNCIELYFILDKNPTKTSLNKLAQFWKSHSISMDDNLMQKIVISKNKCACEHLLRVATSLESAIIGDSQVLGQVKKARSIAIQNHGLGIILRTVLKSAIRAGIESKTKTTINKGNVSIGRATYDYIIQNRLQNDKVLVVGAGKMGNLVAKLLSESGIGCFATIINRTNETARILADKYKLSYQSYNTMGTILNNHKFIVLATSSPIPIINSSLLKKHHVRDVVLIDISNPSNVDKDVKNYQNVKVTDISIIKHMAESNYNQRKSQILRVTEIVDQNLIQLEREISLIPFNLRIKNIYQKARFKKEAFFKLLINKHNNYNNSIEPVNSIMNGLTFCLLVPTAKVRRLVRDGKIKDASIIISYLESVYQGIV